MIKHSIAYLALCLSCLLLLSACGNKVAVSSGKARYRYPAPIEIAPQAENVTIVEEIAIETEVEIAEDEEIVIEIDEEQYQREIRKR